MLIHVSFEKYLLLVVRFISMPHFYQINFFFPLQLLYGKAVSVISISFFLQSLWMQRDFCLSKPGIILEVTEVTDV